MNLSSARSIVLCRLVPSLGVATVLFFVGCSGAPSVHSVIVKNDSDSVISDVIVELDDGAWERRLGVVGNRNDASITPNKNISIPSKATIEWMTRDRKVQRQIAVSEELDTPSSEGDLVFTINQSQEVRVSWKPRKQ